MFTGILDLKSTGAHSGSPILISKIQPEGILPSELEERGGMAIAASTEDGQKVAQLTYHKATAAAA